MRWAAAIACVGLGCAVSKAPAGNSQVAVGGDSPLVGQMAALAQDRGAAVERVAAAAWVEHRFQSADLATDLERADPAAIDAALARGIAGRDANGLAIVVARRPSLRLDYADADWVPANTSNYENASRTAVDHIVIHDTEGSFAGTVSWFQDPAAQVSAHYVVRSSDGHVTQMVAEQDIAYHDKCFNTTTIGIEHEGYQAQSAQWYTEAMYEASAKLTASIAERYGIAKEHGPIVGHGEAPDCSDHTDPGPGWDWAHYIDLVKTGGAGEYLASSITVNAPATLESGDLGNVTVWVDNTGTSAWDVDATRIGTAEPSDRDSSFFVDGAWIAPNRTGLLSEATPAGGQGVFEFPIKAPSVDEPMVVDEAFQLVEEGTGYFGPEFHVAVQITPATGADYAGEPVNNGGCNAGGASGWGLVGLVYMFGRARRPRDRRRRRL
ncbi:MAG: peptidoglycan recognition family protein [Kofleriaceae bacterium]